MYESPAVFTLEMPYKYHLRQENESKCSSSNMNIDFGGFKTVIGKSGKKNCRNKDYSGDNYEYDCSECIF